MITALVSTILGLLGGALPDVIKEWTAGREHKREIERMDKQTEMQVRLEQIRSDGKLAEIEANTVVEEMRAFRDQMLAIYEQQKPLGIAWIDGFNALIRPTTAALLMMMFVAIASAYAWSLIAAIDLSVPEDWGRLALALWGSLVGEAIQAVLGYLFGYRTSATIGKIRHARGAAFKL